MEILGQGSSVGFPGRESIGHLTREKTDHLSRPKIGPLADAAGIHLCYIGLNGQRAAREYSFVQPGRP
jgi:hypothetical protein